MREKLLDLMKSEGLKPSQLAEILEINPAGISHILAGRNKPSFELLQKILRRFPRINPDWLLLDSGSMYRSENIGTDRTSASATATNTPSAIAGQPGGMNFENGLFGMAGFGTPNNSSTAAEKKNNSGARGFEKCPGMSAEGVGGGGLNTTGGRSGFGNDQSNNSGGSGGLVDGNGQFGGIDGIGGRRGAAVQRIVIFYDDQTCDCFFPTTR